MNAQEGVTYFLHTIEKGQSLYSIASMYEVSTSEITALNPGSEEKIYAGQKLKISQKQQPGNSQERFHTIQPGENLYRLTVKYNISAQAICDANPGLSAENFKAGEVIRIPEVTGTEVIPPVPVVETPAISSASPEGCREMHKVKRKETIFSVSREYGVSQAQLMEANPELKNGMKKGMWLCIPYPKEYTETMPATTAPVTTPQLSNSELFAISQKEKEKISTVKAAVILPLLTSSTRRTDTSRMLEYYEGFLIAIDSLKRSGISIDLYTYDSGGENSSIAPVLQKPEMKNMDVIFGPLYQQHIRPLADFAKDNDIRLVIPFTSRDNEVFNNPSVYQINTPQSYLYSEVYDHFMVQFPNSHIIFLNTDDNDKADFIKGLKQELRQRSITFTEISANSNNTEMLAATRPDKNNIFIPTSGSNPTLVKVLPYLTLVRRENPELMMQVFGYPEWQTYTNDHIDAFFELDTYFYSSFYTNNLFPAAINFTRSYNHWYEKEMANTYPKYGMLGFDTGYFFLQNLSRYGSDFDNKVEDINYRPIQTGFKFQRVNNWGGFINRKVFFVRFTPDYELIKLDFE
ncbi:MAG: LysM peptidoglycan-binding domain-containing protein [Bacteroides sp.]|nr:LysM peptidoglycan-binding domain-containing protein [Bacteroides sp.]